MYASCLQNINILTLGNPEGKGVFFPNGLLGAITTPYGYNKTDPGNETYPSSLTQNSALLDTQVIIATFCALAHLSPLERCSVC